MTNNSENSNEACHRVAHEQDGVDAQTIAAMLFAILIFAGVTIYTFSSDRTTTASTNQPVVEQSVHPTTTGQGGVQSMMPAVKDGAQDAAQ